MEDQFAIIVSKLGESWDCESDDRIAIEFSPHEVALLESLFKQLAENSCDYDDQGNMRMFRERFQEAYGIWEDWEEKRAEKDGI